MMKTQKKSFVKLLFAVMTCLLCASCAHTITGQYTWQGSPVNESIGIKGALLLNEEFRNFVYVRKVAMGGRYKFKYGNILTENLPLALSGLFSEIVLASTLDEAKQSGAAMIARFKIPVPYTKIGLTGQSTPTTIKMEVSLLDKEGAWFATIHATGESPRSISAGQTVAAFLFTMPVILAQMERSQNEAVDNLLGNLRQQLLSKRASIQTHCLK